MDNVYKRYRISNDFLINITMTSKTNHRLSNVDWECTFYTDRLYELSIPKSKAYRVDDDNYLCPVVTRNFNEGVLKADLHIKIANSHFDDGVQDEILEVELPKIYLTK